MNTPANPGEGDSRKPRWRWRNSRAARDYLAPLFGFTTLVLAIVVVVQAVALHARGWRPALGTVPEAVAAVGTAGALWIAVLVWRHEVGVRRADEANAREVQAAADAAARAARADQARLLILEFEYDELLDMHTGGAEEYFAATVRNLSERPVFDVEIDIPSDEPPVRLGSVDGDPMITNVARAIAAKGTFKTSYEYVGKGDIDWDWFDDRPIVRFTDANGVRWGRTPAGQPQEVIPEVDGAAGR